MEVLTKSTPSVCVYKDTHYANFWPFEVMQRVVELFEDYNSVDFDDRHFDNLPNWGTQFDLSRDLELSGIIARYEDECYYAGLNFKPFANWVKAHEAKEPETVCLSH